MHYSPTRKFIFPNHEPYFPFGSSQSRNLLQHFRPSIYPAIRANSPHHQQSLNLPPRAGPGPQVQMDEPTTSEGSLPPSGAVAEAPIASGSSSQTNPVSESSVSQVKDTSPAKARPAKRPRDPDDLGDLGSKRLSRIPPSSTGPLLPSKEAAPSADQQSATSVLLLKCHDLHEIMLTLSSPFHATMMPSLDFYINNKCPLNGARNVLILKIILDMKFTETSKDDDIQYLWDVWFNLSWSRDTSKRFREDLLELIKVADDEVYLNIHWEATSFKNVWKDWLKSVDGPLRDPEVRRNILDQRELDMCRAWATSFPRDFDLKADGSAEILNANCGEVITLMDTHIYNEMIFYRDLDHSIFTSTPFPSCRSWIKDGHMNFSDYDKKEDCLNPTLLEQGGIRFIVDLGVYPLLDFLPNCAAKFKVILEEYDVGGNVVVEKRFHFIIRKILMELVDILRQRKEQVSFHFFSQDPLELCFDGVVPSCDIIHSYHLADHVGLANLFLAARSQLVPRRSSTIVMNIVLFSFSSFGSYVPHLLEYFSKNLCCPFTMAPTFFGLKLADVTHHFLSPTEPLRKLIWHWTPDFSNIRLDLNSEVEACIMAFEKMCFQPSKAVYSLCTPQTFNYVLNGLARRSNNPDLSIFDSSRLPPIFKLALKTLEDWYNGVDKVCKVHVTLDKLIGGNPEFLRGRYVRLILSPLPPSVNRLSDEGSHFFDYIDFSIEGGRLKWISFLLTKEHGLGQQALYGYLVDAIRGFCIASLGQFFPSPLDNVTFQDNSKQHPSLKDFVSPVVPSGGFISCLETENEFKLEMPQDYNELSLRPVESISLGSACNKLSVLNLVNGEDVDLTLPHPVVREPPPTMDPQNTRCQILKKSLQ